MHNVLRTLIFIAVFLVFWELHQSNAVRGDMAVSLDNIEKYTRLTSERGQ